MLFLTPIFYSIDMVPTSLRSVLMMNPLTFIVEQLRRVLFYGQMALWSGLTAYFVLAFFFAWASLAIFRRFRPMFADWV